VDGEDDMIGGAHTALVLRIYGDDFKEMRRIGGDIVDVLKGIRGTNDASIFQEPEIPQLVIEADRAAAARYGVNIADVNALIQSGIGGAPVSQVYVADRTYNVTLHMPRSTAVDTEALGQLPLTSTSGAKVPLSLVARISMKTGESTIAHEMGKRQITIRVDNRERALSDYLADAQQKIDQNVKFDHEHYRLEWAGTFENAQRAQKRIAISLVIVIGIMLVLLVLNFGNFRQAALVLGVVPLATLGGLIALHVRGDTLNIATAVGFIALFGVAVQNVIIMVSNFNRVRRQGIPLREAVMTGAIERFRPVLMTATVATTGMLPAALATGVGTDVQRGLATVVVGGLAIATLLSLFILPTYYFVLERYVEKRAANKPNEEAM
jgi:heavy metal efflux system protein